MSMTGRWIDDLQAQAAGGDVAVQEQLAALGLWSSPESFDEMDNISFGHGDSFDDETGLPLDTDEDGEDFEPLGIDEFWALDSSADGEALASAGFGTDEDYGFCGVEDF